MNTNNHEPGPGKLAAEFLRELRNDHRRFSELSSAEKIELYRRNGAVVGAGAVIGSGSYFLADYLAIGERTKIGDNCIFDCRRIKLGQMNSFGRNSEIKCRELVTGDVLYAAGDLLVGAGGENDPDACLRIGDNCFLGKGVVLNPCEEIVLEDEACLSPWTKLFTHGHWQPVLDGYTAEFAPVRIKKGAWVGPNCFLKPGVTVGEGATVVANSFVAMDVPAHSLAGGVPAMVIKTADYYPRRLTAVQKDQIMKDILLKLIPRLQDHGYRADLVEKADITLISVRRAAEETLIVYAPQLTAETWRSAAGGASRSIVLFFSGDLDGLAGTDLFEFDLTARAVRGRRDRLSDEVREHLRKRGLRFAPKLWRYGEDLA